MPAPIRPDDDTLGLAKRRADEVIDSPALSQGQKFQFHINLLPGDPTVRFTEPDRRAVKEMLLTLRQFDAPKDDIRLERLFEIVERVGILPAWRGRVDTLKRQYAVRDDAPEVEIARPDGPATPPLIIGRREAFELWVYGDLIHNDYEKELRWQALHPFAQAFVRQMAYEYMLVLIALVAEIRRVITWGLEREVVERPTAERP
jgi:hypothetical protein